MVVVLRCYLEPAFYAVLLIVKIDTLPSSVVTVGSFLTSKFKCVKEPGLLLERTDVFFLDSMALQVG